MTINHIVIHFLCVKYIIVAHLCVTVLYGLAPHFYVTWNLQINEIDYQTSRF